MPDPTIDATVELLKEIRDLLLPVADAYRDEYERRQAEREEKRIAEIKALLSTDKRRKAWALADGTRTISRIAKEAGSDSGGASRFFAALRRLDAVEGEKPRRKVEVEIDD